MRNLFDTTVKPLVLLIAALLVAAPSFASAKAAKPERAKPRGVTLDVKDADVHDILRSMQAQCGIKNLVIDPGVSGGGTFMFNDVPCATAFDVVLETLGLSSVVYSNSVVSVSPRKR